MNSCKQSSITANVYQPSEFAASLSVIVMEETARQSNQRHYAYEKNVNC